MRYEGKRPSGKDKDIPVYNFVFGQEELRALALCLDYFHQHCPKITETHIIRNRLETMRHRLGDFSKVEKIRL